ALVPEIVSRLAQGGFEILVERGAGEAAAYEDTVFAESGATLVDAVWGRTETVAKVQKPSAEEAERLRDGDVLIGVLLPLTGSVRHGRAARRVAPAEVLSDAYDRRRHSASGEGARPRSRRRRSAGDRDRAAARRRRLGLRRAAGGERAGRVARRDVPRSRCAR